MTDNEIIKALECCKATSCSICPCFKNNLGIVLCQSDLTNSALNLINRQKTEIDKLKIEICALSEKRITFPERLKIVKHAREHAIKEFAEKLKKEVDFVDTTRKLKQTINDLVKEMTEGEK